MRTQRAGNQRLPENYCLTAIALGASGAHDAYRIRAHTFLQKPSILTDGETWYMISENDE